MKINYIFFGIVLILLLIGTGMAADNLNLKEVREKHEATLFLIDGVEGVYDDSDTQEIVVMVEKQEHVKKVPQKLDGYNVKVEVTGKFRALSTEATVFENNNVKPASISRLGIVRPVVGGISTGSAAHRTSAGTLGLVVLGSNDENKKYILSNAHVFAMDKDSNFVDVGTEIWQPGGYDYGTSSDCIGYLDNYIPINFEGGNNYADAAIGTLKFGVEGLTGKVLDRNDKNYYTISGNTTVNQGDKIKKSGRTTGVTNAKVTTTSATVKVYYTNTKMAIFEDQIVTGVGFSDAGDSGSAVVDKDSKFVGLVFAGSDTNSIVCKAEYILNPLNIKV